MVDFDKLTLDLEAQDRTVMLCVKALRKLAQGYDTREDWDRAAGYAEAARWLESDQGRGMVIDLAIAEDLKK